jgi:hypothetical protein
VLDEAGHRDDARSAWLQALDHYERKGASVRVTVVREHLAT